MPGSAAPGWPQARAALAGQLTARLAATAGATLVIDPERALVPAPAPPSPGPVAEAIDYAGPDAVRFSTTNAGTVRFVLERDYRPFAHGEFYPPHADAALNSLAEAYLASQARRK